MSYLTLFPDYDDTLPQIAGFVDSSYGNDTCPSIHSETLGLTIHCDYADVSKREIDGCTRYGISDADGESLLETDDLDEVLAFVANYAKPQHVRVAEKFTELLRAAITPDEFAEMIDANANETDPAICHSHDYIDANQIMLDAMADLGIDCDNDTLWSDAWLHARHELFDDAPEKCRNGLSLSDCTCC